MNKEEKIKELESIYNNLLPKAKSWNRDRLLLAWGFISAFFLTTAFELFRIFASEKYNFKWVVILASILKDYYLIGILVFFIPGFIILLIVSNVINTNADDINKTLNILKKEIEYLKK
jgi:hypothetical protein